MRHLTYRLNRERKRGKAGLEYHLRTLPLFPFGSFLPAYRSLRFDSTILLEIRGEWGIGRREFAALYNGSFRATVR